MKKTFSSKTKLLMRIVALTGLLQAGCSSLPLFKKNAPSTIVQTSTQPPLNMDSLSSSERAFFTGFMNSYQAKSPSARKLLSELKAQGAYLKLFDKEADKVDLLRAGSSTADSLELNRKIRSSGIPLDNTFFHEGEHVVHTKRSHNNGINACSFASLDDVFIYATLMEALAYRKAALCCGEYENSPSSFKEVAKKAEDIFIERLRTNTKDIDERLNYENSALLLSSCQTNVLPNQVYFRRNPDWDQIVSLLSRGEVRKVPLLPQPTVDFLGKCLFTELKKHPQAQKLDEFDISCVLANKSALQKDHKAIKRVISDRLLEVYAICSKGGHALPKKTKDSFVYYMGWPTPAQLENVRQKKITFQEARDANLEKFKTRELFEAAEKLLTSPEIKAFGIPDIQTVTKVLLFEKAILLPAVSNSKPLTKRKVR